MFFLIRCVIVQLNLVVFLQFNFELFLCLLVDVYVIRLFLFINEVVIFDIFNVCFFYVFFEYVKVWFVDEWLFGIVVIC